VIQLSRWDLPSLRASFEGARPFPHVVLDALISDEALGQLAQAVAAEPHWPNRGELFEMMASAESVQHPTLRAFEASLGENLGAIEAITGRKVGRVDLRSYVYLPGSYLLPHSDCQEREGRLVAWSFYLRTRGVVGGELELFEAEMEGQYPRSTRPAGRIEPRENRLVLFAVSPASLHQVREVLSGARISLSGWFRA